MSNYFFWSLLWCRFLCWSSWQFRFNLTKTRAQTLSLLITGFYINILSTLNKVWIWFNLEFKTGFLNQRAMAHYCVKRSFQECYQTFWLPIFTILLWNKKMFGLQFVKWSNFCRSLSKISWYHQCTAIFSGVHE